MKSGYPGRSHTLTAYIKLDKHKCNACWKCIESCPNQVISKVNFPWHKHAKIAQPDACTGCLTCIDSCERGAYSLIDTEELEIEKKKSKP